MKVSGFLPGGNALENVREKSLAVFRQALAKGVMGRVFRAGFLRPAGRGLTGVTTGGWAARWANGR